MATRIWAPSLPPSDRLQELLRGPESGSRVSAAGEKWRGCAGARSAGGGGAAACAVRGATLEPAHGAAEQRAPGGAGGAVLPPQGAPPRWRPTLRCCQDGGCEERFAGRHIDEEAVQRSRAGLHDSWHGQVWAAVPRSPEDAAAAAQRAAGRGSPLHRRRGEVFVTRRQVEEMVLRRGSPAKPSPARRSPAGTGAAYAGGCGRQDDPDGARGATRRELRSSGRRWIARPQAPKGAEEQLPGGGCAEGGPPAATRRGLDLTPERSRSPGTMGMGTLGVGNARTPRRNPRSGSVSTPRQTPRRNPRSSSVSTPQQFDLTLGDVDFEDNDYFPDHTPLRSWVLQFDMARADGDDEDEDDDESLDTKESAFLWEDDDESLEMKESCLWAGEDERPGVKRYFCLWAEDDERLDVKECICLWAYDDTKDRVVSLRADGEERLSVDEISYLQADYDDRLDSLPPGDNRRFRLNLKECPRQTEECFSRRSEESDRRLGAQKSRVVYLRADNDESLNVKEFAHLQAVC